MYYINMLRNIDVLLLYILMIIVLAFEVSCQYWPYLICDGKYDRCYFLNNFGVA